RHPSVRIVDLIKYHAFKIKAYLSQLTGLVEDDKELAMSIKKFHIEALFNIGRIISESLTKLDFKQKDKKIDLDMIHISAPLEKTKLEHLLK
ncbi:MAG: hypothetical protein CO035_07390, partial [Candidatus Omnitrophica bacterium CG_4_9_14_0_2_um_filter_42_8]